MILRNLILLAGIFLFKTAFGTETYDKNYFRSPVDIKLAIVSNFGELRNNHFHNGLDIRTNGQEGLNIYSVADGYVSRIKISHVGYGLVMYVTHPNGYVSVYAHLKSFNDTISKYIKKAQYLNETWEIELFPDKKTLPVKKGEILALSGNTGSSQGPHLHFEIREEESEVTVNPLLFGFDIPDAVPPIIRNTYVYPIDEGSFVNGKPVYVKLPCVGSKGNYKLKVPTTINVTGSFGMGLDAIDQVTGTPNPNGVYGVEIRVDGQQVYSMKLDKVGFDENRYINSHCDYVVRKKTGGWIQKCFIEPGNKLGIYKRTTNNGKISFSIPGEHLISYYVSDINGNTSSVFFKVNYEPTPSFPANAVLKPQFQKVFRFDQFNEFKNDEIQIQMPAYTIYNDIEFQYQTSLADETKGFSWNKTHYVHNGLVPVHSYYDIAINGKFLPEEYKDKAVIVSNDGFSGRCEGGTYENGWIKAKTRTFGTFKVSIDKTAPTIKSLNLIPGKNMSKANTIVMKIGDNLSGIKSYKGYIDGKWVLFSRDKGNNITHRFEPDLEKGRHDFKLVVVDERNNQTEYNAWFVR